MNVNWVGHPRSGVCEVAAPFSPFPTTAPRDRRQFSAGSQKSKLTNLTIEEEAIISRSGDALLPLDLALGDVQGNKCLYRYL